MIDDDAISLQAISSILVNADYHVAAFSDAKVAWDHLCENHNDYAVTLTDRIMYGIDAIELLHRLKLSSTLQHIPVIVCSGEASTEEQQAVLDAGAFAFLFKPITSESLLPLLKSALQQSNYTL